MKTIMIHVCTIMILSMVHFSCQKVEIDNSADDMVEFQILLDTDRIEIPAQGKVFSFDVITRNVTIVECPDKWITSKTEYHDDNVMTVTITADANDSGKDRKGNVIFHSHGVYEKIDLEQESDNIEIPEYDIIRTFVGKTETVQLPLRSEIGMEISASIVSAVGAKADVDKDNRLQFVMTDENASITVGLTSGLYETTLTVNAIAYLFDNTEDEYIIRESKPAIMIKLPEGLTNDMIGFSCEDKSVTITEFNEQWITVMPTEFGKEPKTTAIYANTDDGFTTEAWTITLLPDSYVWIEDRNFRKAVIDAGLDANGNRFISREEAETITRLDLKGKDIHTLNGIECFKNLQSLDITDNARLDTVDLSCDLRYLKSIQIDLSADYIDVTGCRLVMDFNQSPAAEIHALNTQVLRLPDVYTPRIPESEIIREVDTYRTTDFSHNGEVMCLQEATVDRYKERFMIQILNVTDRDYETGVIEELGRQVCEDLFAIEPMKSFRHYFEVNLTVTLHTHRHHSNNPKMEGDLEKDKTYSDGHRIRINLDEKDEAFTRSNDVFISYNQKYDMETLQHEATGHMFARLTDEYLSEKGEDYYRTWTNVTKSNKIEDQEDWWQELAKYDQYKEEVTTFHQIGNYCLYYTGYVNSLMLGTHPGNKFSSVCRYLIWARIHAFQFTDNTVAEKVAKFVEYDQINMNT